jgi:hypothetical protein
MLDSESPILHVVDVSPAYMTVETPYPYVGSFFYLPDVARLPNPSETLHGVRVYIGDGATLRRTMVRTKDAVLLGHPFLLSQGVPPSGQIRNRLQA